MRIPALFLGLAALAGCAATPLPVARIAPERREPVTILIGVDGARQDYLSAGLTPNLARLAATGVSAAMQPSFPTKTFPNFWTLATGVRPDRSGIIGNTMEDAARPGERFTMETDDPFWWNAARPIWIAAEEAGIRSAAMFWPGSTVGWGGSGKVDHGVYAGGRYPSDWQAYAGAIPAPKRVDAVVDWLRRPAATRPRFVALYFDDVDIAGHDDGPDAPATRAAMHRIDAEIGRLQRELAALGQPANLIVVADHGMAATPAGQFIALDTIAPADSFRTIETGPYASIEPLPGKEAVLAAALSGLKFHMNCWPKAAIPARLRYGTHPRVPTWLCLADPGWIVLAKRPDKVKGGGAHGYDDAVPEMQALFVAGGPAFRAAGRLPAFRNTAIHPLLRRVLGMPADPSLDNDATVFAPALK